MSRIRAINLEADPPIFRPAHRDEVRAAVVRYGIWIDPLIFRYRPHLVPFAVRDAAARSKANAAGLEQWGSPTGDGFFRDDNSLIKEWVKAFAVSSPSPNYNGLRARSGFVACHVWRSHAGGAHGHGLPLFNSFVPNLVWLPRSLARESDVVGSHTQLLLQRIAFRLYSSIEVPKHLRAHVEESWKMLEGEPRDAGPADDGTFPTLSLFKYDATVLMRKHRSLESLVQGLRDVRRGTVPRRIQSSRYGPGIAKLPPETVDGLIKFLEPYIEVAPR